MYMYSLSPSLLACYIKVDVLTCIQLLINTRKNRTCMPVIYLRAIKKKNFASKQFSTTKQTGQPLTFPPYHITSSYSKDEWENS